MGGREEDLEKMNRKALQMAREVAREKGLLFAGGPALVLNTYLVMRNLMRRLKLQLKSRSNGLSRKEQIM